MQLEITVVKFSKNDSKVGFVTIYSFAHYFGVWPQWKKVQECLKKISLHYKSYKMKSTLSLNSSHERISRPSGRLMKFDLEK